MPSWKSASVHLERPAGEVEALRSLTAWERVVFSPLLKRLEWAASNVEGTKAMVASKGFVWLVHLEIANDLTPVAGAVGFAGLAVYVTILVTGERALWPVAALGFLLGGALLCWGFFRLLTLRRAGQLFVVGGRVQAPLAEFSSAPPWTGFGLWAFGVFALDLFVIGVVLANAAYPAPRITGAFFLTMDGLLIALWAPFARAWLGRRRTGGQPAGRQALSDGGGGPSRKAGGARWALVASVVYCGAIFSVQSTLGPGLTRDAAAQAAPTTTSPGTVATSVPGPATTTPVTPDQQACETIMGDSLAGVPAGQSTRQVVESFEKTARATMDDYQVAVSALQFDAVQYLGDIKSFGPSVAMVVIQSAVASECTSLVSEGFKPST